MQNAVSESGHHAEMAKTLRWWDGVAITLSLPAALFVSLGYSVGALGTWAAITLWACIALVAVMHNWLYAEMGAMFAEKSGGIALYANEAWRHRVPAFGPLATYAYWFAWATAPAIWGLTIAQILTSQFWPDSHFALQLAWLHLDLAQCIALAVALLSWALSMIQLRFTMIFISAAGVLLMVPVLMFGSSFATAEHWSTAGWQWHIAAGLSGVRTTFAWFFVMAWSAYAVEAAASFIPEFRDTISDTRRALRVSALVLLVVFTFTPLGLAGLLGEKTLGGLPDGFLQAGAQLLFGNSALVTTLMTLVLIAGILVLSVMGTADAARALYQSSRDGLTIRQFDVLNRAGVPARAVTTQLLINIALVLFVGNALAVIVAGNIGYILAHLLAVSGFVVLRRDQPAAPRPIRLPAAWTGIAAALAVFDALILVFGMTGTAITGYGDIKEVGIAIVVIALSQVLYGIRRWQDRSALNASLGQRL